MHKLVRNFARDSHAAVSPLTALLLIPLLGTVGLVVDVGYWYYKQRDMQNAADSAAIAAAQTPDEDVGFDGTNDDFIKAARGTALRYGYQHDEGSVSVDATRVPCPADPTRTCTRVSIGYDSPLFFSPIVGFFGDGADGNSQGIAAVAIAGDGVADGGLEFCLLSLDTTSGVNGISGDGVPKADLNGCDIFSNNDMNCNGHNMGAGTGVAVGSNSSCGEEWVSGAEPFEDPYTHYASNIPANPCSSYPVSNNKMDNLPASNKLPGAIVGGGVVQMCGDVLLTGETTLANTTLVIYNGRLISNGNNFTANNSTVVFAGDNNASYHHYLTDKVGNSNVPDSAFTISSPTSGNWSGVAVYTDPSLTVNVDMEQSGESPAFNLSGLLYTPNSDSLISGIINKAGTGYNCFVWVSNTIELNGTAQIFANPASQCDQQGLDVPSIGGEGGRPWLVF
ncbi:pilus assembly protein TadG-related protein [Aurantiacibacter odishensis]|uniref:pilus assembly protein TadG-related protein n=1 Tax=Aurantiacibacter odishensis TaxID=1155476 RepID=UPI0013C456E4|nr:pilus assembly protein TadG-related protein [Aurantiacibacter odishensis]